MECINFDKLKYDLLQIVGTSGFQSAILEVECATREKLIALADRYSIDLKNYITN
jgi:hypothetical protein